MPPRSDKTRDNNPNWRGGNPYLPYIKQLMEKKCEHTNKAYSSSGTTLACYPPINISCWICKDCGFEGSESYQYDPDREYRETKQKFANHTTTERTPDVGVLRVYKLKEGV